MSDNMTHVETERLACPHCGKSIRDIQHAVNEVGRLHAKNERLRAALTELINNTRPESRMSDLRSARLNALAALDRDNCQHD